MENKIDIKIFIAVLLCFRCVSMAVVLHPETEPPYNWTDHPPDSVIGRWGSNASCVAIAPNAVLTTIHQNGGNPEAVSPVVIDGTTYAVKKVYTPNIPDPDFRICVLYGANLSEYVPIYTASDEVGKLMVLGGYGRGRGETLAGGFFNKTYGYTWAVEPNTTLRWGQNRIDSITDDTELVADFDGPSASGATDYECTAAEYDSGSGWFINSAGVWQLAGVTYGVTEHEDDPDKSWVDNPDTFGKTDPDTLAAYRLSYYADWISLTLDEIAVCSDLTADINGDCVVDSVDMLLLGERWLDDQCVSDNGWCDQSDIDQDSAVSLSDFAVMASQWLQDNRRK